MLDHDEVVRLYGPWKHRTPEDAAQLLESYSGRWWIAGGWAIDAFAGSRREHGDLDLGIPREEAEGFVDFVSSTLDAWAAFGILAPILPNQDAQIPDRCGNLWLRASGADPWEYDVLLEEVRGITWHYKRAPHLTKPLVECLWEHDGITYLRPEVQLLLKAKHARPKDTLDLERCLPHLQEASLDWLEGALRQERPGHRWLKLLAACR
ncbi:nucleotidyltransferase domain-containing protein [Pseudactinotalea sp. Z1732]|uniref:nucleotidyltransferase domain-containing protein n=1 Tax=Micrococcales TaxID=85006 RepID=UPI003C7DB4D3